MTILCVGIATNRLLRQDIPMDDRAQPWLVDVAAELMSEDGKTIDMIKRTVRLPKDAAMQQGAEDVNHITTRSAKRAGGTQKSICYVLMEMMNEARFAVSYGDMTKKVVASIIQRSAGKDTEQWLLSWNRPGVEWVDLRTPATQICKLPHDPPSERFRWPSRSEAAVTFLGETEATLLVADGDVMKSAAWLNMRTDRALFIAMREAKLIEALA